MNNVMIEHNLNSTIPKQLMPKARKNGMDTINIGSNKLFYLNYPLEKHYEIDPEFFFSHYNSNGWQVEQNKMTDWKSAYDKWVLRERADKKKITTNTGNLLQNGKKPKFAVIKQLEALPEFTVVEAKGKKFIKDSTNSFLTETENGIAVVLMPDFVKMFPKFDVKGVELPENFSP